MKNELHLIDMMLKRRSDSVSLRSQEKTCTTSKQFSRRESDPIPEVCGFPIHENMYHQLSIQESHIEGNVSVVPVEVEDSNDEEFQLIDPRQSRAQK